MLYHQLFFSPFAALVISVIPIVIAAAMRDRGGCVRAAVAMSGVALVIAIELLHLFDAPLFVALFGAALILPLLALAVAARRPDRHL